MGGRQVGWKMTFYKTGMEPGALSLIEQAVNELRRNNAAALSEYYLGTLPFVLSLLYFWSDMSRNPMAGNYCGPAAAGLALLFIWMKLWQLKFCRRLWCRLEKATPEKWPLRRMFAAAARQSALHATGVVILPLAALLAVPLGWVVAFYQNVGVLDDHKTKQMRQLVKAAKEQAVLWPGQNHLMLTLMTIFGFLVFVNLGAFLLGMPYLLKSILGIETVFTLSGAGLLNTTFLAVLGGLTYLCIDPVLKAVYVYRCFYGASLRTGDDLKSALRPFLQSSLIVLGIFMICLPIAVADGARSNPGAKSMVRFEDDVDQLDHHLDSVLEQRRFAWRMPREKMTRAAQERGWIGSTLKWAGQKIKAAAKSIGEWIDAFFEWLVKKIPTPKFSASTESENYQLILRWMFYALGFGLALWLAVWMVRWLKHSRPVLVGAIGGQGGPEPLDLADESITAEDLPLERWLAMAQEMMERHEFRKAVRALYLSVLANLADHQRLKIAQYKSNGEYARELARRSHAEPELLNIFGRCISLFERSWYGMHPVGRPMLDQFMDYQKRIANLVQSPA
jgi:hypothetical protein